MAKLPPIYKEHGKTYQADTCRPVVRAVEAGDVCLEALARGHYPGRRLKRNALPGVKTVGFWDAKHDQDWGLDWHRNEGIELTFLETGQLAFAVDDHSCRLQPNDLTITRPWQPHRVGDPHVTAGRLYWLILDVGVHRPHQAWRWPAWLVRSEAAYKRVKTQRATGLARRRPIAELLPPDRQSNRDRPQRQQRLTAYRTPERVVRPGAGDVQ